MPCSQAKEQDYSSMSEVYLPDRCDLVFLQGVNPLQLAMEMKRHGLNPDVLE